jgi:uncharacterized repeat protein (TIGR02543 family)
MRQVVINQVPGARPIGAGNYMPGTLVTIDAGTNRHREFSGWTVVPGHFIELDQTIPRTTFFMPDFDVILTPNWEGTDNFFLTVNGSHAEPTGEGSYPAGSIVEIFAGTSEHYLFSGWTVDHGDVTLTSKSNASTWFVMPTHNVTVTAHWGEGIYSVRIDGSRAYDSGSGRYYPGQRVAIYAGEIEENAFVGWTVDEGEITLVDANSITTSFTMPSHDVFLTANWSEDSLDDGQANGSNERHQRHGIDGENNENPFPGSEFGTILVLNEWTAEINGVKPYVMVQVDAVTKVGAVSPRVFTDFIGGDVDFIDGVAILRGYHLITGEPVEVTMKANDNNATINGIVHDIATYSGSASMGKVTVFVSQSNNFYVPLRFMTEAFGYYIEWDPVSASATILK